MTSSPGPIVCCDSKSVCERCDNATGLQEKITFIGDPAAQRKGFRDHDWLADIKLLQILEGIDDLARVWMDVDGDGIEFGTDGDLVIGQLALAQVVRKEVRRKVAQYMPEGEFFDLKTHDCLRTIPPLSGRDIYLGEAYTYQMPLLPDATADEFIGPTRAWLERAVIGLNLCPFAQSVHARGVKLKDRRLAFPPCDQFAADLVGARFGWLDGPLEPAQPGKVELTPSRPTSGGACSTISGRSTEWCG